jgi:hypothetical protein
MDRVHQPHIMPSLPRSVSLQYISEGPSPAARTVIPLDVLCSLEDREQGKVAELRLELNNGGKKDKNYTAKKIALKKIVANMTMSNSDMVALFPDIIDCMRIPSLEIKKM